jgi:hypothetical protein
VYLGSWESLFVAFVTGSTLSYLLPVSELVISFLVRIVERWDRFSHPAPFPWTEIGLSACQAISRYHIAPRRSRFR